MRIQIRVLHAALTLAASLTAPTTDRVRGAGLFRKQHCACNADLAQTPEMRILNNL